MGEGSDGKNSKEPKESRRLGAATVWYGAMIIIAPCLLFNSIQLDKYLLWAHVCEALDWAGGDSAMSKADTNLCFLGDHILFITAIAFITVSILFVYLFLLWFPTPPKNVCSTIQAPARIISVAFLTSFCWQQLLIHDFGNRAGMIFGRVPGLKIFWTPLPTPSAAAYFAPPSWSSSDCFRNGTITQASTRPLRVNLRTFALPWRWRREARGCYSHLWPEGGHPKLKRILQRIEQRDRNNLGDFVELLDQALLETKLPLHISATWPVWGRFFCHLQHRGFRDVVFFIVVSPVFSLEQHLTRSQNSVFVQRVLDGWVKREVKEEVTPSWCF